MSAEPAKGEPEPGVAGDEEYERLRLALQLAVPGELLVVQVDSGQERARLPERLAQDGLQRPWIYVDLAEERVLVGTKLEPLPVLRALGGLPQMLRALLQAPGAAPPEVVFLDGLERWLNADAEPEPGDALEQLSLSREALAALPAVVVFLLPGDLVQLLRERALNLWTWRAYDFALATDGAQVKRPEPTLQVWLKSPRGDSREARARRVHVYRNLLAAQEERGRLLPSLYPDYVEPLLNDLDFDGNWNDVLGLIRRTRCQTDPQNTRLLAELCIREGACRLSLGEKEGSAQVDEGRKLCGQLPWEECSEVIELLSRFDDIHGQPERTEPLLLEQIAAVRADETAEPDVRAVRKAQAAVHLSRKYITSQRYEEAGLLLQETIEDCNAIDAPMGPLRVILLKNCGEVREAQGLLHEAEDCYAKAATLAETVCAGHHVHINSLFLWGRLCLRTGKEPQAELLLRLGLELERRLGGVEDHTPDFLLHLARACVVQKKWSEAEVIYREGIAGLTGSVEKHPGLNLWFAHELGRLLARRGAPSEAQRIMEAALAEVDAKHIAVEPDLRALCYLDLGQALLAQQLPGLAETYLQSAHNLSTNPGLRAQVLQVLSTARQQQGRAVASSDRGSRDDVLKDLLKSPLLPPPGKKPPRQG